MTPFHAAVKDDFQAVNQTILTQLHSDVPLIETIGQHIIDGGGKRLRPLLVLLSALSCQYQGRDHINLATIIEFIHTATLLHDDVVDQSNMRRGRNTANAIWDNSAAVLVGDFLYSRAFQMLAQLNDMDIMSELSNTTNIIAEGEVQQLINAGKTNLSEQDYLNVIFKKTAILFNAAMRTGAVLAASQANHFDKTIIDQLGDYGSQIGIAFQIRDDVLDYAGDTDTIGKNLGDDLAEGKMTLPIIYAMRAGSASQKKRLETAMASKSTDYLTEVLSIIESTGALKAATLTATNYRDKAISNLNNLTDSPYRQALIGIAEFSIDRDA